MPPSISAAGVSIVSDRRRTRFDHRGKGCCTSCPVQWLDLLRWHSRKCLALLSVVTFHLEDCKPLTFVAGFQREVCRAQTERAALVYISDGKAAGDGLNVLAFKASDVHVN